jgi:hypothetical protein
MEDNYNTFEKIRAKNTTGERKAKAMDFIQLTKRYRWKRDINSIAD